MIGSHERMSARGSILLSLIFLSAIAMEAGFVYNTNWYWLLIISLALLMLALLRRPSRNIRVRALSKSRRSPDKNFRKPGFQKLKKYKQHQDFNHN